MHSTIQKRGKGKVFFPIFMPAAVPAIISRDIMLNVYSPWKKKPTSLMASPFQCSLFDQRGLSLKS